MDHFEGDQKHTKKAKAVKTTIDSWNSMKQFKSKEKQVQK